MAPRNSRFPSEQDQTKSPNVSDFKMSVPANSEAHNPCTCLSNVPQPFTPTPRAAEFDSRHTGVGIFVFGPRIMSAAGTSPPGGFNVPVCPEISWPSDRSGVRSGTNHSSPAAQGIELIPAVRCIPGGFVCSQQHRVFVPSGP